MGGDEGDAEALEVVSGRVFISSVEYTICPAPTTPSFFTSKAIEGVEENWRLSEASLCEATCDFGEAINLDENLDSEAIGGGIM